MPKDLTYLRNLVAFAKQHDWYSHWDDKGVIVIDESHHEATGWTKREVRFRTMRSLRAWAGY